MRASHSGRRRAAMLVAGLGLVACGGTPAAPVEVDVDEDVEVDNVAAPQRVAAGGHTSCAIGAGGAGSCWGANYLGQMGSAGDDSPEPRPIEGDLVLSSVSLGGDSHGCGLDMAGSAYCWGLNSDGQLGDGTYTSTTYPVAVAGEMTFSQVRAGPGHTCGLAVGGKAYCWGNELGTGFYNPSPLPVEVVDGHVFVQIAVGRDHVCGLEGDGVAWCWGGNGYGQLGDPDADSESAEPIRVLGVSALSWITAGDYFSCGLSATGQAFCWGANEWGQLGDGTFTALRRHPVAAMPDRRFAQIVAGGTHTCALDGDRKAHCWGHRFWGNFAGDGSFHWSSGAHRFGELALGTYHACGIDTGGSVRCWGPNLRGELGTDASTDWSATPVVVPGSWS